MGFRTSSVFSEERRSHAGTQGNVTNTFMTFVHSMCWILNDVVYPHYPVEERGTFPFSQKINQDDLGVGGKRPVCEDFSFHCHGSKENYGNPINESKPVCAWGFRQHGIDHLARFFHRSGCTLFHGVRRATLFYPNLKDGEMMIKKITQPTRSFPEVLPEVLMDKRIRKFPFLGKRWAAFPDPWLALISMAKREHLERKSPRALARG